MANLLDSSRHAEIVVCSKHRHYVVRAIGIRSDGRVQDSGQLAGLGAFAVSD
jgi:hypothetical protein